MLSWPGELATTLYLPSLLVVAVAFPTVTVAPLTGAPVTIFVTCPEIVLADVAGTLGNASSAPGAQSSTIFRM
jgi:hypothetical protein